MLQSGGLKTLVRIGLDIRSETYSSFATRRYTLKEIVRLLGPEALPDEEKLILEVARMIKIGILQQNSFDEVDTYCSPRKTIQTNEIICSILQ